MISFNAQVDDGKLSERTISDELPQVWSATSLVVETIDGTPACVFFLQEPDKTEQDVSRPEQDGTSVNGTPGKAVSSDATPADNGKSLRRLHSTFLPCCTENTIDADYVKSGNYEGAESVDEKPKKLSPPEADQNKLDPSDKSEEIADADAAKEGPASSIEAANGATDDTSGPAAITPVKRRGRPPGPKSDKKAAGKNQPSSDVKKTEEATDSAGKLTKQSAKGDGKSSVKKTGEGESSKKDQKVSSKQEKNETLSEEDPSKDLSLKVSFY